jgi:hypothetical protein
LHPKLSRLSLKGNLKDNNLMIIFKIIKLNLPALRKLINKAVTTLILSRRMESKDL